MGMHIQIHIGAYLKIEVDQTPKKIVTMKCPHNQNVKYNTTDFYCKICGTEIKEYIGTKLDDISYWDLFKTKKETDKYEDELRCVLTDYEDEIILIGNSTDDNCSVDGDIEYGDFEITEGMITKCKTNFKKHYKEIINFLRPQVKTIEVKFGTIVDYN